MASSTIPANKIAGGSFLIDTRRPDEIFSPEDFTDQHRLIAQTAEEFAVKEIVPNIDKMERKDFSVTRELLKKGGELGLSSVDIPEAYGGMEMDKVTSAIIADHISKYAGFATSWGGHTGIGTLPIVYFGTEEQKQKYLPRLATGEIVGAYALSEASSGSDALNCRARAQLSPDGKHYILNGEKMWITNAGFADLFTVFAKVDGEKFTAFLVEKSFPGFSIGAEEHKMGIRGSSTCPLILNDCKVPAENLLGEIGKGTSSLSTSSTWDASSWERCASAGRESHCQIRLRMRASARHSARPSSTSDWCAKSWPTWPCLSMSASRWFIAPSA